MSTCDSILVIDADVANIVVIEDRLSVLNVIGVGPTGATGASGGETITTTAAIAISGLRAVYSTSVGILHADNSAVATSNVLGISRGSAITGGTVLVQPSGEMQDPSWTWIAGAALYLSTDGNITQIVPSAGIQAELGVAKTATEIIIRIYPPISLN
jgi:hypothetical protein